MKPLFFLSGCTAGSAIVVLSVFMPVNGHCQSPGNLPSIYLLLLDEEENSINYLVKDIWTGPESSEPDDLVALNGLIYFDAKTETNGKEVWISDGTPDGTKLLKDIKPGIGNSDEEYVYYGGPEGGYYTQGWNREFTLFNNFVYFTATDGDYGAELWKSDGTSSGTIMVKDIREGSASSGPSGYTVFNNMLYFTACDSNGCELWISDGSEPGTSMVKNIAPGSDYTYPYDGYSSWPNGLNPLTPYNGALYFSAVNTSPEVCGLWKTDGTEGGTVPVKPGVAIDPDDFQVVVNGKLYFAASDGVVGNELWESDGTPAGTKIVKDIFPGPESSNPRDLILFNNNLFFTAIGSGSDRELWKSDGTESGTVIVKDIYPGPTTSYPQKFMAFNNLLYFVATDSVHGEELWQTNGTVAGTVLTMDIQAGAGSSSPQDLTKTSNALYFNADDGIHGQEVWKVDISTGKPVLVKDLLQGSEGSEPYDFEVLNDVLYFQAYYPEVGNELWKLQ